MPEDRDLLEVLKFELRFLEKGGYAISPQTPWRPRLLFEDSPACMNYDAKDNPAPCTECVLVQLVPPRSRAEKVPCRHIPLNEDGETVDSLYRTGTPQELEEAYENWLRATIERLEEERASRSDIGASGIAKCANPACPVRFHYRLGGKFYRFRGEPDSKAVDAGRDARGDSHNLQHFWLCARCCQTLTLVYAAGRRALELLQWNSDQDHWAQIRRIPLK